MDSRECDSLYENPQFQARTLEYVLSAIDELKRLERRPKVKMYVDPKVSGAKLPTRGSSGSIGFDAYTPRDIEIAPGQRILVDIGVFVELPADNSIYIRVAPKSGRSITLNGVYTDGVIDPDFRGRIKVNCSSFLN
jgi:dUTPase